MATIQSLQRQIDDLRSQLNSRNREIRELTAQIRSQAERDTRDLEQEVERRIRIIKNQSEASLKNAAKEMESAYVEEIRRAEERYNTLIRERDALMEQLVDEERKLQDDVKKMKDEDAQKKKRIRAECARAKEDYKAAVDEVKELPHAVFFPHKLDLYQNSALSADELEKDELYSEAQSRYSLSALNCRSLAIDTQNKAEELRRLIDLYEQEITIIERMLASDEIHTQTNEDDKPVRMNDAELDYWSDGTFGNILDIVASERAWLDRIKNDRYGSWITESRAQTGTAIEDLLNRLDTLHQVHKQCRVIVTCAFSSMLTFNSMFVLRGICRGLFEQSNYLYRGTLFGPAQETDSRGYEEIRQKYLRREICTVKDGAPDYREKRVMYFYRTHPGEHDGIGTADVCAVTLSPIRCSDTIQTKITLSVKADMAESETECAFIRMLAEKMIVAEHESKAAPVHPSERRLTMESVNRLAAISVLKKN